MATINKETKINLGLVLGIITTVILVAFWIKDSISENTVNLLLIGQRLASIEASVNDRYDELNQRMSSSMKDRIYKHEITAWINLLEAKNPDMEVPPID